MPYYAEHGTGEIVFYATEAEAKRHPRSLSRVELTPQQQLEQIRKGIGAAQRTLSLAQTQRAADIQADRALTFQPPENYETINRMPVIDRPLPPGVIFNMPVRGNQGPFLPPGRYPTQNSTAGATGDLRTQALRYLQSIGFISPDELEIQGAISYLQSSNIQPGTAVSPFFQTEEQRQRTFESAGMRPQESVTYPPGTSTDIINEAERYLRSQYAKGNILNPNLEISSELLAQFTAQAREEIDPFYANQLKLATESLLRGQGYTIEEIGRLEREAEQRYAKEFRALEESAAERGFALSGIRQRAERELAEETQGNIENIRSRLGFEAGTQAREFAQHYGAPPTIPSIPSRLEAAPGERTLGQISTPSPLYSLSPEVYTGLIGEKEFERRGEVRRRAAELGEAERQRRGTEFIRSLTL